MLKSIELSMLVNTPIYVSGKFLYDFISGKHVFHIYFSSVIIHFFKNLNEKLIFHNHLLRYTVGELITRKDIYRAGVKENERNII